MTEKLYVSNLAFDVTEQDLRSHFSQIGTITNVRLKLDKHTNKSRGFGFVSFATALQATQAIEKMNKTSFRGRTLFVTEARPHASDSQHPTANQTPKPQFASNPTEVSQQHSRHQGSTVNSKQFPPYCKGGIKPTPRQTGMPAQSYEAQAHRATSRTHQNKKHKRDKKNWLYAGSDRENFKPRSKATKPRYEPSIRDDHW